MIFTPNLLGIFADIYGSEEAMTMPYAVLVAAVGFVTVIILLAIIALFIKLIAMIFSLATKKKATSVSPAVKATPVKETSGKKAKTLRSEVTLYDVDEPTAAVIMALVSHNSGIPLEKLDFISIRPLEDK